MWVWSVYLQRELTINSVSVRVGDSLTWVLAILVGVGIGSIITANFLPVQTWKVFLFLVFMVAIDTLIIWLTASWVHAIASHKIPLRYRRENNKRENITLSLVIIIALVLLTVVMVTRNMGVVVLIYMFTPILVLIERTVSLKMRIKEISKFEIYTEEEVLRAEESLIKGIEEGTILTPRDNVLKKLIKREQKRIRIILNSEKTDNASENMENIKRKNDELSQQEDTTDETKKGDDKE